MAGGTCKDMHVMRRDHMALADDTCTVQFGFLHVLFHLHDIRCCVDNTGSCNNLTSHCVSCSSKLTTMTDINDSPVRSRLHQFHHRSGVGERRHSKVSALIFMFTCDAQSLHFDCETVHQCFLFALMGSGSTGHPMMPDVTC